MLDPYRVLFPIGLVLGAIGVGVWLPLVPFLGGPGGYPAQTHADLMVGGFLFAFATGFLLTAIPKFVGSMGCAPWELVFVVLLEGALLGTAFGSERQPFYLLSALNLLFLAYFFLRRFASRSYAPPPFFLFVAAGIIFGIAGAGILAFSPTGELRLLGRNLYFHGMMLCFVVGVGGRLLPALFGRGHPPVVQLITRAPQKRRSISALLEVAILAAAFVASYPLESFAHEQAGRILRALVISWVAFSHWKLHRRPEARGKLPFWLWCAAWNILLGTWVVGLFPAFSVHGAHLIFVGGFSLMTLLIASRVTLAHGGHATHLEAESPVLRWVGVIILASAATRLFAPMVPKAYLPHLGYAALTWLAGLLFWAYHFVPKMMITASSRKKR